MMDEITDMARHVNDTHTCSFSCSRSWKRILDLTKLHTDDDDDDEDEVGEIKKL